MITGKRIKLFLETNTEKRIFLLRLPEKALTARA
jgi:hypothetical protein